EACRGRCRRRRPRARAAGHRGGPRHRRARRPPDPRRAVRRRRGRRARRLLPGARRGLVAAAPRAPGGAPARAAAGGRRRRPRAARRPRVRRGRLRRARRDGHPARQPRADGGLRRPLGRHPRPVAAARRRLPAAEPLAGDRPRRRLGRAARRRSGRHRAAALPGAPRPLARRDRPARVRARGALLRGGARAGAAGDPRDRLPRRPARGDEPLRGRAVDAARRRVRGLLLALRAPVAVRPPPRRDARGPHAGRRGDHAVDGRGHRRAARDRDRDDGVRRREGGAGLLRRGAVAAGPLPRARRLARLRARAGVPGGLRRDDRARRGHLVGSGGGDAAGARRARPARAGPPAGPLARPDRRRLCRRPLLLAAGLQRPGRRPARLGPARRRRGPVRDRDSDDRLRRRLGDRHLVRPGRRARHRPRRRARPRPRPRARALRVRARGRAVAARHADRDGLLHLPRPLPALRGERV
ncbi:MAG: hypothetical protein AVDCRST_MAG30-1202, partial [uncultured Solirubrobacteraceae bacterium]